MNKEKERNLPAKVHVLHVVRLFVRFGHLFLHDGDKVLRAPVPVRVHVVKARFVPEKFCQGTKNQSFVITVVESSNVGGDLVNVQL